MSLTVFLLKIQILPNDMLDLGMREAEILVKVCTMAESITETLLGRFAVLQGNYGFLKNDAELLIVRNGTAKGAKFAKFFVFFFAFSPAPNRRGGVASLAVQTSCLTLS